MPNGETIRNGHKCPQKRRWAFSGVWYTPMDKMRAEAILWRFARGRSFA